MRILLTEFFQSMNNTFPIDLNIKSLHCKKEKEGEKKKKDEQ